MKPTHNVATKANKTDAGNGSYGICRVIDASRSPSPDPRRSSKKVATYPTMKTYQNIGGDSGIVAYDYDSDSITVQFKHGGNYRYSSAGIGASHLAELKRLADSGDGLNSYINTHPEVKKGYDPR